MISTLPLEARSVSRRAQVGVPENDARPKAKAPRSSRLRAAYAGSAASWAGRLLLSALSIAAGLLFWHLAVAAKLDLYVRFENIPAPLSVLDAFVQHLSSQGYYIHILVSLKRILISYCFACVIGILLGLAIGRSRVIAALALPYIELIRPIPAVAWIPISILAWPTEEGSIIYITFLGALFPIVLNTIHGVESTPEVLVRAARSLGADRFGIFRYVILPAALPSIAAGLVIAMGVSWFSLLAGEIISGQFGIGYFTWNAYSLINYQDIVVGMISIGALGTLSTYAVKLVTRPALRWQRRTR